MCLVCCFSFLLGLSRDSSQSSFSCLERREEISSVWSAPPFLCVSRAPPPAVLPGPSAPLFFPLCSFPADPRLLRKAGKKRGRRERAVEVRRAIPREEAREHGGSGADRDAGRLFVGGISDDVNDESLRAYFRHYGEIQSANVMVDRQNNRPRGFGFVIFRNPDDAEKAIGPHKKLGVHCEAKRAQPRQMNRDRNSGGWGGSGSNWGPGGYGGRGYGGGREGGYGGGRGRDYGNYGPPGGAADPAAGYGMGGPGGVYGGGGYGGYANYNPYYAAYYAQMAAYSAMGGYGGYGGAAGAPGAYGVGSDEGGYGGSPASGGADRGNRMANRSTPY